MHTPKETSNEIKTKRNTLISDVDVEEFVFFK